MKPGLLIALALFVTIIAPLSVAAQDDESPVPLQGTWTYTALTRTADCGYVSGTTTLDDQAGNEDFEATFPLYVLDEGEQLLLVFNGDDFHYTAVGPGLYEGTLVSVDPDETYQATMTVVDEETLLVSAVYSLGVDCVFTYENVYALLDETPAELWSETARTLTNTSLGECLARTGVAEVWIENDLLVPLVFPDDLSGLRIGTDLYTVSDAGFEHVTADTVGDSEHVFTTQLDPVDDNTFRIDFLYQVDKRDDCAIAYTSELWRVNDPGALLGEAE